MSWTSWTRRLVSVLSVVLVALAAALFTAPLAQAHEERPVTLPDGTGSVPRLRTGEPDLLVRKADRSVRRTADRLIRTGAASWTPCLRPAPEPSRRSAVPPCSSAAPSGWPGSSTPAPYSSTRPGTSS
ncbi:hypothetical protein [Streptomyces sp. NPDC018711]|uniref:hypothetical protein n=1 Tax=Streptomyces sp. NPDC018711 TaxID=3365052 RepID=UPI003798C42D